MMVSKKYLVALNPFGRIFFSLQDVVNGHVDHFRDKNAQVVELV